MKGLLLKLVAGQGLRMGLSYSYEAVVAVIAALRGVLEHAQVSDDARKKITTVITGLSAVRDFLAKVMLLVGAPTVGLFGSSEGTLANIDDAAAKLRRITDTL